MILRRSWQRNTMEEAKMNWWYQTQTKCSRVSLTMLKSPSSKYLPQPLIILPKKQEYKIVKESTRMTSKSRKLSQGTVLDSSTFRMATRSRRLKAIMCLDNKPSLVGNLTHSALRSALVQEVHKERCRKRTLQAKVIINQQGLLRRWRFSHRTQSAAARTCKVGTKAANWWFIRRKAKEKYQ